MFVNGGNCKFCDRKIRIIERVHIRDFTKLTGYKKFSLSFLPHAPCKLTNFVLLSAFYTCVTFFFFLFGHDD